MIGNENFKTVFKKEPKEINFKPSYQFPEYDYDTIISINNRPKSLRFEHKIIKKEGLFDE